MLLCLLAVAAFSSGLVDSGYLITTPRRWTIRANSQVCVTVTDPATFSDQDSLRYKLTEFKTKTVIQPETNLVLPSGKSTSCLTVPVPHADEQRVTLDLSGTLGQESFKEAANLTIVKETGRTFIQTDKYLYKPGQKVQIRILSVNGPHLDVVTDNYEEVYIVNPSRTRIAQWNNVNSSNGLVHLSFDLFDEVEEGQYLVGAKLPDKSFEEKSFRVEDYVLPRYEVTIEGPKRLMGSDKSVTVKLCAKYTFGEPVNGVANISLAAGSWRIYANLTEKRKIAGCEDFTFPTVKLLFDQNNCHIRISGLKARATVLEDGTGVELFGSNDNIVVHRKALKFTDESPDWDIKAYLPVPIKIAVKYPDNSPAINETMEVCTYYQDENVCKNFTTCNRGFLNLLLPSQIDSRLNIRAPDYPQIEKNWNNVMEESKYYKYRTRGRNGEYFDPTNSSLTIYATDKLECTSGDNMTVQIPIIYLVKDQPTGDVHIQVISRGQIVLVDKMSVDFKDTSLPFNDNDKLLPLEKLPPGLVRGVFNATLNLPASTSPRIKVLVWYTSTDGVVVADSKEIRITDCLPHKVSMSWSTNKTEPGKEANLIVSGANDALCSIGVVDKSVELLSSENEELDITSLLRVAYNSEVSIWDEDQLNLDYCVKKYGYPSNSSSDGESGTGSGTTTSRPVSNTRSDALSVSPPIFRPYTHAEAIHMFKEAGYFVFSSLTLEKEFCDNLIVEDLKKKFQDKRPNGINALNKVTFSSPPRPLLTTSVAFSGGANLPPESPIADFEDVTVNEKEGEDNTQERSYLPETWLWTIKPLSSTGSLSESVTLPDSITEWVGRSVCVHPSEGVGISSKSSIVTFTPFFVDLTLPSSVKRGETLPVKISIFNYLDEDLPVKLFVESSEDYKFVEGETGTRELCIPSKQKMVETVKLILNKIGDINITTEAASNPTSSSSCGSGTPPSKKDRLIRSLPVEPEGYPREKLWTKYICSQDVENLASPVDTWTMAAPETIVEGSERAWITASGDLMGPTVDNLGHLVRLPSGCGEQNMVNFAPNIYILQYLESSNQTTEAIRAKITKLLNHGYQRQQKFRHSNGAFSAFGEYDKEGSTWVTAFVVKSLANARPFTYIDTKSLEKSANWLKSLQTSDGCFDSRGRVLTKSLQGGFGNSGESQPLLTAYVLGALLEAKLTTDTLTSSAVKCVNTDNSTHPYNLALRSYTLALAKDPSAQGVIDELLKASVSNSSDMRWPLPDRKGEHTALHVETAAYALLALVTFDHKKYAEESRKIVRWMSDLRNGQGGFISTQDTVVALQALAAFEKAQPKEGLDMVITLSSPSHSFTVKEQNRFLQQRVDVPSVPTTTDLIISGTGCSLVQGVLRYNVLADSTSDAFTLSVTTKVAPGKGCKTHRLSACATYNLSDKASNMAIIEFKLISGFVPLKEDLKAVIGDGKGIFKRYEVDNLKTTFYLEEITGEEVCVDFRVHQEVEIENAKPGHVTVYDYYQPEFLSTQKFTIDTQTCSPSSSAAK